MSKNQAPRVQFNFLEDEIDDSVNENVYEDDDTQQDTLSLPEPVEREVIEQENIFDVPQEQNQLVKELVSKELPKPKKQPKTKEPKLTKTGKVRKPMSEKQKANLARGRERALESRRRKKMEKEEAKMQSMEEAELLKKKRKMELDKLKKEVEQPTAPAPAPAPVQAQPQGIFLTPKQLEEAQLSAIMSYEKIRAERKKVKEEQQLIAQQKQDIKNKLMKPVGYSQYNAQNNRFYGCY